MSYIISSAALGKLVLAADGPGPETTTTTTLTATLTPSYAAKSEPEIPLGLRLFYCVGLGLALASMLAINLSHTHKVPRAPAPGSSSPSNPSSSPEEEQSCRLPHWARAANRAVVCCALCCLPAAGAALDSLRLVGLATALCGWVLAVELLGQSARGTSLLSAGAGGGGRRAGGCRGRRYTARCSRRELREATKRDGEILEVRELGGGEKSAVPGALG